MPTVLADADRIRHVFELELARQCTDQLVVGGLDRMLIQMHDDGDIPGGHPLRVRIECLGSGGYRALPSDKRAAWLKDTIAALKPTLAAARGSRPESRPPSRVRPATRPAASRARDEDDAPPVRASGAPDDHRPGKALAFEDPITRLPGIGKAAAEKFAKIGVETVRDAVMLFPRRFNDFRDMRKIRDLRPAATPQTVAGEIVDVSQTRFGARAKGSEALINDGTGLLKVAWFNMPYVARSLSVGDTIVVSGKVRVYRGRIQMDNPEFEPLEAELLHTGRLVPVYPATQGLGQKTIRRAVKVAVDALASRIDDPVPGWLRNEDALSPLEDAVQTYHYPEDYEDAEKARRRIAIGEFLAIQTAVLMRRAEWQRGTDAPELAFDVHLEGFLASLPFTLTASQDLVLAEILRDIRGPVPMLRLLQGDVGSGKTIVAFAAAFAAVASGHQAVIMAPTEILAEQHYRSLMRLLGGTDHSALDGVQVPSWLGRPVRAILVTGSLTATQKALARGDAANGGADILIGTHALLEAGVEIPRLGLAVIDEQHRFGVLQRAKLRQKGTNPHLLVMTATPIPRTLALTVYGDLEVSTIDSMPPGRKPVKTRWYQPHDRDEAYAFIRRHLDEGEQVFIICPLVEESETLDAKSAEEEYERLRHGPLASYRLDLLHGRMPGRQKDEIMGRFGRHEIDVLVSTSVIEVGIDVPNATVMVIEGAERFGLSQMHQFRGRVGRSSVQSYCLLFSTAEDPGPEARDRLEAMVSTTDGFKLAEIDLEFRGEGEAWGRVQSGANSMLRVAKLTDRTILAHAREMARRLLERDPQLQLMEHRTLAASVKPFLEKATEAN